MRALVVGFFAIAMGFTGCSLALVLGQDRLDERKMWAVIMVSIVLWAVVGSLDWWEKRKRRRRVERVRFQV